MVNSIKIWNLLKYLNFRLFSLFWILNWVFECFKLKCIIFIFLIRCLNVVLRLINEIINFGRVEIKVW